MRKGFTLLQLLTVLGIVSIVSAIALPRIGGALDGIAVRGAAADVASAFALARYAAITRNRYVSVRIDSARRSVTVASASDTLLVRQVGTVHGVGMQSNRDSMAYDPIGLGYGASNQSIVVTRGKATDTVVISRLGRVRHRG